MDCSSLGRAAIELRGHGLIWYRVEPMPPVRTLEEAVALVRPVDRIGFGLGPGIPDALLTALGTRTDWEDLQIGGALCLNLYEVFTRAGVSYRCGFFVLASHHEGLPVALMEALSVGLPVVATAVGGVPQFVNDSEEGLLVTPGRPDLLAGALVRVCSDSELRRRLGEGAKSKSTVFDVRSASAKIEDIYRRLVEASR
jgi:hypothetical protein